MSNGMKVVRGILFIALAAAIGVTIKECRSGGISWVNNPKTPPACVVDDDGARNCPLRTHNPN